MNKKTIDISGFYYKTPTRVDGDIMESFEEYFKIDTVSDFLKESTFSDFLYLIIRIFKEDYPDVRSLATEISEKIKRSTPAVYKSIFRKEIDEIKWEYFINSENKFEYYLKKMRFKFNSNINGLNFINVIKEVLDDLDYEFNSDLFIIKNNSIEEILISTDFLELKINVDKIKYY